MDETTHRKCNVCQGTGWIPLDGVSQALVIMGARLERAKSLRQKILVVCEKPMTAMAVRSLLTRYDKAIDGDWVHYNILNMEEEGLLIHHENTDRYVAKGGENAA